MSEGGEGAPLSPREEAHLRGLAQTAVMGESRPGTATTDLDRRRLERARQLAEGGRWNESLKDLQGEGHEVVGNIGKLLGKFGINRRHDGSKNRSAAEQARYDRSNNALHAIELVATSENYDQLPPAEQTRLRGIVESALMRNSRLPDFSNLTRGQRQTVIERFLRDPRLKAEIIEDLRAIQGMHLVQEKDLLTAQRDQATTRATGNEASRTATRTDTAAGRTRARLDAIQSGALPPTPAYTIAEQAIADETTIRDKAKSDADDAQSKLSQAEIDYHDATNTNHGTLILSARDKFYEARDKQRSAAAALARAEKALTEAKRGKIQAAALAAGGDIENTLETKLEGQYTSAAEARIASAGAAADNAIKQLEIHELREEREHQEHAITDRLEGVFTRALDQFITKELQQSLDHLTESEGDVKKEAFKLVNKALQRHLETRWGNYQNRPRGIFRRSRREYVLNRRQISRDYDQLLQRGDEPLMRGILERLRVEQGGTRVRLDDGQIRELLNNQEFANQMRGEVVKQVVARRAMIQRLRPGELHQLMEMSAVQGSVQEALDHNQEYRARVQALIETDDMHMDDMSFRGRFSRIAASQPGLLLFPVTTIPWSIWSAVQAGWQNRNANERNDLVRQIAA